MRNYLLTISLFFFISATGFAQSTKFFAVTGETFGSVNWIAFRQFDMSDHSVMKTLYIPAQTNEVVYDALTTNAIINNADAKPANPQGCGCLNSRMVAAIAYDAVNNRLYYTPMMSNQLRYLDLNSNQPKSHAVTMQVLKNFADQPGEASIITRMCFAANGFGYALTNDNQHLIQFSTKKQSNIKDLGALADDKMNGEHSIQTQLKSWGGDMIADAKGSLYLFTMQRGIFKINPLTKVATYIGDIKNVPADYTINAAMVESDASVIVASSTNTSSYYRVDLNTLQAVAFTTDKQVYNVSDFANANLAFDNSNHTLASETKLVNTAVVNIYPNPVINKSFALQFKNFTNGKYAVQISEATGKMIMEKDVNIAGFQTEKFNLSSSIAAGTYIVKVIDKDGTEVYTAKIIVS